MSAPKSIPFSSGSRTALDICLTIILFGVTLGIKLDHFTQLVNQKKAVLNGLLSLFVLLLVFTVILVILLPINKRKAL